VSVARRQAQIDATVATVWSLLGDPNRYPEWWPRIVEVECEGIEQGCTYKHVARGPVGTAQESVLIEALEDCREVKIRCLDTGTYMRWVLMGARDGTFVDVEFGMDPGPPSAQGLRPAGGAALLPALARAVAGVVGRRRARGCGFPPRKGGLTQTPQPWARLAVC
jgi:hypothetical protein